ncbi:MAG: CoA-transferase [Limibacillus sp.]|jgi:glutaconate CoA-transferase subunit A
MVAFMSLPDAIGSFLKDGDRVAFEGFSHLIPHAAAHETIRQRKTDLTLIRMTPDMIYDQLIGMGAARKMIFSYAGNPGVGLLHRFRDAVEQGWPRPLELEEHSHSAMANAYGAGAAGLPCAVFRGYIGAELKRVNPNVRSITCPFTGEELAAIPALNPDVGIIHAQKANRRGDVLIEGIMAAQKETVLASAKSIVTVEEIVEDFEGLHPNLCILPHWTVDAICLVPGGAHPSYAQGYYARDNAAYHRWDAISKDRAAFQDWMEENVLSVGPEVFAERTAPLKVGG